MLPLCFPYFSAMSLGTRLPVLLISNYRWIAAALTSPAVPFRNWAPVITFASDVPRCGTTKYFSSSAHEVNREYLCHGFC